MPALRTKATLCAGAIVLFSNVAAAHGGQYMGPGDIVPPGGHTGPVPQPTGPTTPEPTGPKAPSPTGPSPIGPTTPTGSGRTPTGAPPPGARTGGGIAIVEDLTEWSFWWEFNKNPYLRLKTAVHQGGVVTGSEDIYIGPRREEQNSLKPTTNELQQQVLPALKRAIDATNQRDMVSSCMVAMAKIGVDHPDFHLVDVFAKRLATPDQEVRETAALAIGIAGIATQREVDLLQDLALDRPNGRSACGGPVDARTRSFAIYALGQLASRNASIALKRTILPTLRMVLADDTIGNRDPKVAAIHAVGMLEIDAKAPGGGDLFADALGCLENYYQQPLGVGEQLIQAHCPTAIAKLVGRDHPDSGRLRALFAADLRGKANKRTSDLIAQSCALALGRLVPPLDEAGLKGPDAQYSALLVDTYANHKDAQTRYFALMSLGQIGGSANRATLLRLLKQARNLDQPWCALALGVLSYEEREQARRAGRDALTDKEIGDALADAFVKSKDPSLTGALGIALGLAAATEAADAMRERMQDSIAQDRLAGYLCVGLALMNDTKSRDPIHQVMLRATRRADLLQQAAVALGKLGDKSAATDLQKLLTSQGANLATLAAAASAIGYIGDRRSITPLEAMLFDKGLTDLARAFAAVALGGIADKDPLPWNSRIGVGSNYRAACETLTNQETGILDIL